MDEKLLLINNYLTKLVEINREESAGGGFAAPVDMNHHLNSSGDVPKGKEKQKEVVNNRPASPRDPLDFGDEAAFERISSSARSSVTDKKRQAGFRPRSDSNTSSIASVARSSVVTTTTGGGKI